MQDINKYITLFIPILFCESVNGVQINLHPDIKLVKFQIFIGLVHQIRLIR